MADLISTENKDTSKSKLIRNIWIGLSTSFALGCVALAILPLLSGSPPYHAFVLIAGLELFLTPLALLWLFGKRWGLRGREGPRPHAAEKAGEKTSDRTGEKPIVKTVYLGEPSSDDPDRDIRRTTIAILVFGMVGCAAIVMFAVAEPTPFSVRHFAKTLGLGLLYAGAFFGIGALTGFLFGIPRSLDGRGKQPGSGTTAADPHRAFVTNTNLEEISDWLTKIIVGLGLINLKAVPGLLKTAAWYFGNFCGTEYCEAASLGLILYFSICGFFLGYLATRLFLTGAFSRAEGGTISGLAKGDDGTVVREVDVPIELIPAKPGESHPGDGAEGAK